MPNPTKPPSSASVISSSVFGRPVSDHVVRAYLSSADRDADVNTADSGQVATVGYQLTARGTAWGRSPARADVNQVNAAGEALIPANSWVTVGAGCWSPVPKDADVIVTADVNGLEIPDVSGTPILLLGVLAGPYGWVELARSSVTPFWQQCSMHGTAHLAGWGAPGGAYYFQTGLYVTNNAALRAGLASFSLHVFSV